MKLLFLMQEVNRPQELLTTFFTKDTKLQLFFTWKGFRLAAIIFCFIGTLSFEQKKTSKNFVSVKQCSNKAANLQNCRTT